MFCACVGQGKRDKDGATESGAQGPCCCWWVDPAVLGTLPSPVLCAHGQGVVMRGMFLTCATTRNGMRSGSGPGRISIWNKRVRLTAAAAAATTSKAEATSTTGVHTGFAYATHTHTHTHTQKQQDLFVAYQQKNTHQRRRLDQHQPAARLIRLQKITAKKQKNSRRKFLAGSNICDCKQARG
jgi:hypothetical protein